MSHSRRTYFLLLLALLVPGALRAQVTPDRLLHASDEPQNWLTYSGSYASQRHSLLKQVSPSNVKSLELKWVFQAQSLQKFETTPLVVDGIMYITQSPNDVIAVDAKTGRAFWLYHYAPSPAARPCCGIVNRGLAMLGSSLPAEEAERMGMVWQVVDDAALMAEATKLARRLAAGPTLSYAEIKRAINLAATNSPSGFLFVTTDLDFPNAQIPLRPQPTNSPNDPGVDGVVTISGRTILAVW